ncbi:MAG: peptidylprolyl isomerase [Planctomycetota bacterium]
MTRTILWVVLWLMPGTIALAGTEGEPAPETTAPAEPAALPAETEGAVIVRMETSLGIILLELDTKKAPITVANFLSYADEGFYNGTIFHRVIPNFLIQGGGYMPTLTLKTNGLHDPIPNEWDNGLKNVRSTIAAARVPGKPDSATSEFFINVIDNPRLDQAQEDGVGYAVFGRVVAGEDVVEQIRTAPLHVHPRHREPSGRPSTPVRPIVIKSVRCYDPNGETPEPNPTSRATPAPHDPDDPPGVQELQDTAGHEPGMG